MRIPRLAASAVAVIGVVGSIGLAAPALAYTSWSGAWASQAECENQQRIAQGSPTAPQPTGPCAYYASSPGTLPTGPGWYYPQA